MSNKMLIDATHPEETRVVVLRGNRVEEFDFEAADRQQLRGNIYLAKVTRVEPSLQAAFVEYGGNRHGFLAFSEIHPDYYQIPFADRQVLLQEQAREDEEEAAEEAAAERSEEAAQEASAEQSGDASGERSEEAPAESFGPAAESANAGESSADLDTADEPSASAEGDNGPGEGDGLTEHHEAEHVESVGAVDALEEVPERRKPRPRQYKIQEVIKRRQVLLVQVVKEERGNKGAALTTYLSLAGRYSVLMPNTGRGGGISRKITNPADRKRLKAIANELDVPEGMGVILRTAGANRTKTEVKRDFEYLLRLWENVRELTLRSTAPKLVYEEGSLIKRSIRDLYSREIDQVIVAGDDAYREAKDFMRMLMPSHARNVQQYRDDAPIFARNGVEAQLDAMFSPQVTLRSGGYIVINQTEALVSIDVNSGRSTREHSIEDTALNTNLEASEEIARQLRLRDLAGLIVIDFIDMEENRNNRAVERKLKDCLRADRARIQLGRISHFGLMEMSRQRIRTGVLESSTVLCPHCRGTGQVRSVASLSLQILRAIEDTLLRHGSHHLHVSTRPEVALYVLNQKRRHLAHLEARFGLSITIIAETPENGAGFIVERGAPVEDRPERDNVVPIAAMQNMQEPVEPELEDDPDAVAEEATGARAEPERVAAGQERDRPRRRRRRRGNGEDRQDRHQAGGVEDVDAYPEPDLEDAESEVKETGASENRTASDSDDESGQDARRRRRGRRGGRRRGRTRENGDQGSTDRPGAEVSSSEAEFAPADVSFADDELAAGDIEQPYEYDNEQPLDQSYEQDNEQPLDQPHRQENQQPFDQPAASGTEQDHREEPSARPINRDGHTEEVAALTEAVQGRGEEAPADLPTSAAERDGGSQPMMDRAEPVRSDGETAPQQEVIPDRNPVAESTSEVVVAPEVIEDDRPKRSGWWNRRSFF